MKDYQTEQEKFWAGEFGDEYISRNNSEKLLASKIAFFSQCLKKCISIQGGVLELGSNIGLNLKAIGMLFPKVNMTAVEINENAAEICKKIDRVDVFNGSIFDFQSNTKFDLTFTKGVLIHINPDKLNDVYEKLYKYTNRYILISEYYNPKPIEVSYRGNTDRLFKRDFAGELMDKYSDLELIDYGFIYHRDNNFPDDDNNWFLLEKKR